MKIRLNGEEREVEPRTSIAELVRALGFVIEQVAVERNQRLVRREQLSVTPVEPGDRIEIVTLVGGG
jgi:thiamine biosynthesis protein ThiS